MNPTLYVIAGPNGAGKTTFATQYLPRIARDLVFLNADLIAAGLSPFAPEKEGARAGRVLLSRFRELVQAKETFAPETTLAGKSYARLFHQIKGQGYRVVLFFFWLPTADMAVARVANRVCQGGHHVPEIDIRRRFQAGWRNFGQVHQPIANEWRLVANGHFPPVEIAKKVDGSVVVTNPALYGGLMENKSEYLQGDASRSGGPDSVMAALRLASLKAVEIARQTGTEVIVWRAGLVQRLSSDQVDTSPARNFEPGIVLNSERTLP